VIGFSNVSYRYPHTSHGWVLEGIDLTIKDGEYLLVCGGSGSGKSTFGYHFNGLIPHFFGGVLKGSVLVDGLDTAGKRVCDFLSKVGLVFQNADAQLFNSTVENEIAFGLESLGLSARQINRQIRWVTELLRIEDLLGRSPTALSGGEKRLVALASVLSMNPPTLLLDEPFAHLDWVSARRVREALREIHRGGKTIVVIEQRFGGLLQDATRCIVLECGKILFDGHPGDAHPVLLQQHLIPRYLQKERERLQGKHCALVAEEISYRMENRQILKQVSLKIEEGERLAIVGRNGSGKTTLIKHLNGLLMPAAGKLTIMGEEVRGKTPRQRASLVGISFQNPNDQFFKNLVRDELLAGVKVLGKNSGKWFQEICILFGLHELLDRSPYRLSEGQKKRVALASIVLMHPKILVLDEPTVGQDGRFLEAIAGLLVSLEERGFTIVIVTHDLAFASATADRWIVLHEGQVVGDGSPRKLSGNRELIEMGAIAGHDLRDNGDPVR